MKKQFLRVSRYTDTKKYIFIQNHPFTPYREREGIQSQQNIQPNIFSPKVLGFLLLDSFNHKLPEIVI